MTTSKKPKPSNARNDNKLLASVTKPPAMLANDSTPSPTNMLRRKPQPSALKPTTSPKSMLAICTADNKKPACTKLM